MDWDRFVNKVVYSAAAIIALLVVTFCPGNARSWEPEEQVVVYEYCVGDDRELAKGFTTAVEQYGNFGYDLIMKHPDTPCYDLDIHRALSPVRVTLVEKLWDLNHPDGTVLEVWVAVAGETKGFVWLAKPNGDPI